MWMKQNDKQMRKWDVNIQECPVSNEEIKKFVQENLGVSYGQSKTDVLNTISKNLALWLIMRKKHIQEQILSGKQKCIKPNLELALTILGTKRVGG